MKKLNMLLAAALVAAMTTGFAGCQLEIAGGKQDDDTPARSGVVTWENPSDCGEGTAAILTAFDNEFWHLLVKQGDVRIGTVWGTYTGDASKDGEVECKMTYKFNHSRNEPEEIIAEPFSCTISGNTLQVPASLFGVKDDPNLIDFTRK